MVESMFETYIARVSRQVVPKRGEVEERVSVEVTDLGQRLGGSRPGRTVLSELACLEGGITPFDIVMTLIVPSIDEAVKEGSISGVEATSIFTIAVDLARRRQEREGR